MRSTVLSSTHESIRSPRDFKNEKFNGVAGCVYGAFFDRDRKARLLNVGALKNEKRIRAWVTGLQRGLQQAVIQSEGMGRSQRLNCVNGYYMRGSQYVMADAGAKGVKNMI